MPRGNGRPAWVAAVAGRPALTPAGLRQIRVVDLGLSVAELAAALSDQGDRGVSRHSVYAWERGETPIPSYLLLALLELGRRRPATAPRTTPRPRPGAIGRGAGGRGA